MTFHFLVVLVCNWFTNLLFCTQVSNSLRNQSFVCICEMLNFMVEAKWNNSRMFKKEESMWRSIV